MPTAASGKPKIKFLHGDLTLFDQIQPLWERLIQLMSQHSTHFKAYIAAMKFQKRKADLLEKAITAQMRIDIAVDEVSGENVGYIVSSLNSKKVGEIESIFVLEAYRGMGIGGQLMRYALSWMDQNGAVDKVVKATVGNEEALEFYSRFGFLPRLIQLELLKHE